ncbi:MAG TPA: PEP-CTERM sorting domain-containing protein [Phycisphaerae bacterium]|nr:PEP-CTERM sorting domain-containing protein [Phycisphaerae bacterium]
MQRSLLLVLGLFVVSMVAVPAMADIITFPVDRTNGQSADRAHIGAFDGNTDPVKDQPAPLPDSTSLEDGHYVFSDRTYPFIATPAPLVGANYVQTFNNDKATAETDVNYAVTLEADGWMYITVDDRLVGRQNWVDNTTSAIGPAGTFTDTLMNLYIREKTDGSTDRPMSVFGASLAAGTYNVGAMPSNKNFYQLGAMTTEPDAPLPDAIKINFEMSGGDPTPAGYLSDTGDAFGDRGNGYSYGWDEDTTAEARNRNDGEDERYDSINHMQKSGDAVWEIALPNGEYDVFIVCGDPDATNQTNMLDVEGTALTDTTPLSTDYHFDEYLTTVTVSDGRLTIMPGAGASNAKIAFLQITPEPATLALLGFGLGGLLIRRKR